MNGLFPKKSTPPRRIRHAGKSHGRGVNGSGNPDGRGALNLKYILGVTFDFIDVSIASIDTF